MKELTGIKLINWHYFTDVTLSIKGSALLTGENASGKSTILDAIQLVLVGDLRQIKFNVSAHDETDRTLSGYIRCKTGTDNSAGGYLRQGDFTSYIVLEFLDTEKNSPFLLGCVVDAYGDKLTEDRKFFKLEGEGLSEPFFKTGERPRNIKEFRTFMRSRKGFELYNSVEKYRQDLLQKMGSLGQRFFPLFVRAIGFKPITDIRKFVYEYILEEKKVEIESMQQNFQYYRDLEDLVNVTEEKILRLQQIEKIGRLITRTRDKALVQEYLILRAGAEFLEQRLQGKTEEREQKEGELQGETERIFQLQGALKDMENRLKEAYKKQGEDANTQKFKFLENELQRLEGERIQLEDKKKTFVEHCRRGTGYLEQLKKEENRLETGEPSVVQDTLEELSRLSRGIVCREPEDEGDEGKPMENSRELLSRCQDILQGLKKRLDRKTWGLQQHREELLQEIQTLEQHLEKLKNKQHVYNQSVLALRQLLQQKLKEHTGEDQPPDILCELLEIPDEKWQNAVEGFLNTRRFDLLVDPGDFDYCLKIYEQYKKEKGISGVGLVNTGKVLNYLERVQEGSLAEEVTAKNQYARGYVNLLLGNLMKSPTEKELKQYSRSITPSCMTYQNNAARQIHFKVYQVPFIGERAFARQIQLKEKHMAEQHTQLRQVEKEMDSCREMENLTGRILHILPVLLDQLGVFHELKQLDEEWREKNGELQSLDKEMIDKLEKAIRGLERDKENLLKDKERSSEKKGALDKEISFKEIEIEELQEKLMASREHLGVFCSEYPRVREQGEVRYGKESRRLTPEQIKENFTRNRKTLDSRVENLKGELIELQKHYNQDYQFGGRIDGEDTQEFQRELKKLVESELPDYREKIKITLREAEQQFKEHFVFRLREYIDLAKKEFDLLNGALNTVQFGQDCYNFMVRPSDNLKKFYEMVMDTSLLEGGGSLFDDYFREKHAEAMDQLFEKVLLAPRESLGELAGELTDYRNYLEYDIRITHSNGDTSLYSRVCREKSGGETQTPFYVAMLASFVQLYRIRSSRHTLRLAIFDEAFNRMDADRIENSLRFIKKLGLQVIIAVPTEKCEDISPYLSTTLLVLREGLYSWVEDFRQLVLEGEDTGELPEKPAVGE